jgi:hypothetical protein
MRKPETLLKNIFNFDKPCFLYLINLYYMITQGETYQFTEGYSSNRTRPCHPADMIDTVVEYNWNENDKLRILS